MSSPALPADARRSLRIYNLFFPFVFAALLPSFLLRMFRRGHYRQHFGQRLGIYSREDRARFATARWTWIHSISVGETLIALKLARELHERDASVRILLSVTTTTGLGLARDAAADWLEPLYNPVDFLPIVRRALAVLRPARVILIEGEAWPNLLAECHRRGIPISLANARLSPRSERRFRRFRAWTGPIFRLLDRIAVPEPDDVPRWESLGVPREKLTVTGSIKFDDSASAGTSREQEFRALLAPLGVRDETPILVAGSTHDGEEAILASLGVELRRTVPDLFLILVPRHVERTAGILRELAPLGLRIARRTALPPSGAVSPCDLFLVDTTGELRDWYALATIAFVGKSLTAIGGQNPAEPAILGKPTIFGPHMENFASLAAHLVARNAAIQVSGRAELHAQLHLLLFDAPRRAALGRSARHALSAHQGATRRTAAILGDDPLGSAFPSSKR